MWDAVRESGVDVQKDRGERGAQGSELGRGRRRSRQRKLAGDGTRTKAAAGDEQGVQVQRDLVEVEDDVDELQPATVATRGDVGREHAGEHGSAGVADEIDMRRWDDSFSAECFACWIESTCEQIADYACYDPCN